MRPTKLKNKRLVLLNKNNKHLLDQLDKVGLFAFYEDNSGEIIGVSQVIAFLFCGGYDALQRDFTSKNLEVHHINGEVDENNADNLIYLSKEDHDYVSRCSFTPNFGRVAKQGSTPFNKQGKKVINATHFLINVLQETVAAVSCARTGKKVTLTYTEVLMSLPATLWNEPLVDRLPKWMTTSIMLNLQPKGEYA